MITTNINFPVDTPDTVIAKDDILLFADISDGNKAKDCTVDALLDVLLGGQSLDSTSDVSFDTLTISQLTLDGTTIPTISVNGTLSGNSATSFLTQKAIKTYVDANIDSLIPTADIKVANYTAIAKDLIKTNTSGGGFTITMPVAPTDGDKIAFVDIARSWHGNSLILDGNGKTIDGSSGGFSLNINDSFIVLQYCSSTGDWFVNDIPGVGTGSVLVSGYTSGGYNSGNYNTIDKFNFGSNNNAIDFGDLSIARQGIAGQSSSTNGYTSGGYDGTNYNTIDKFNFGTNNNASDFGDLTIARYVAAGQSSNTDGYTSGGYAGPTNYNTIDKFNFGTNNNASDFGDLTITRRAPAGQSSSASGYTSGGISDIDYNTIDKFNFGTNNNASDFGDLTITRHGVAGQSSSTDGYASGGTTGVGVIDKFNFGSNNNASDFGDLSVARYYAAGQQGY